MILLFFFFFFFLSADGAPVPWAGGHMLSAAPVLHRSPLLSVNRVVVFKSVQLFLGGVGVLLVV